MILSSILNSRIYREADFSFDTTVVRIFIPVCKAIAFKYLSKLLTGHKDNFSISSSSFLLFLIQPNLNMTINPCVCQASHCHSLQSLWILIRSKLKAFICSFLHRNISKQIHDQRKYMFYRMSLTFLK